MAIITTKTPSVLYAAAKRAFNLRTAPEAVQRPNIKNIFSSAESVSANTGDELVLSLPKLASNPVHSAPKLPKNPTASEDASIFTKYFRSAKTKVQKAFTNSSKKVKNANISKQVKGLTTSIGKNSNKLKAAIAKNAIEMQKRFRALERNYQLVMLVLKQRRARVRSDIISHFHTQKIDREFAKKHLEEAIAKLKNAMSKGVKDSKTIANLKSKVKDAFNWFKITDEYFVRAAKMAEAEGYNTKTGII